MAELRVTKLDDKLMHSVKVAAAKAGLTMRGYVSWALTEILRKKSSKESA